MPESRPLLNPGSYALVTGATNPLGRAVTLELARRGVHVFMVAREWEHGFALREQVRAVARTDAEPELFFAEFSLLPDALALAERLKERTDQLDAIFHFSGLKPGSDEPPAEEPHPSFVYNVLSPFVLTQKLEPLLDKTKGVIIGDVASEWRQGRLDWSASDDALWDTSLTEEDLTAEVPEEDQEETILVEDRDRLWADSQAGRLLWLFAQARKWTSAGLHAYALKAGTENLALTRFLPFLYPRVDKLALRALDLIRNPPLPRQVWWPGDHSRRLPALENAWLQDTLWNRLCEWGDTLS